MERDHNRIVDKNTLETLKDYIFQAQQNVRQETTSIISELRKQSSDDHDMLTTIHGNVQHCINDVTEIKNKLDKDYLTKDEFDPVKKLVFGMVGIILTAVVVALVALVIKR